MKKAVSIATKRMQQSPCPRCGQHLDGLTHFMLEGRERGPDWRPSKGDFSICVYCAAALRFEDDLRLREVSHEDLIQLLNEDPKAFVLLQDMLQAAQLRLTIARRKNRGSN